MNKEKKSGIKALIAIVAIILIIGFGFGILIISKEKNGELEINPEERARMSTELEKTNGIDIVATTQDKITADSSWCGTFQLVWNDLKDEVVKKDIVFNPQEEMANNLNRKEFTKDMLSDEYYFKKYGVKSLELKEEIEKGIKEKFNQESDILEDFDWSENGLDDSNNSNIRRYFFYVMLYRKFEFLKEFDKLENGSFGDEYNNIEYFGIDKSTDNEVRKQIEILYYNSKDDFAIILNTKSNDEVIFCKNPKGETFSLIYENMNNEAGSYKGNTVFEDIDEFKAPKIEFAEKREYKEFQGKEFETADSLYPIAAIEKAIQTIKFSLDEKGGEIKSEAAIDMKMLNAAIPVEKDAEPRYFYVDDTFAIFLREKGKDMPY